MSHMVAGLERKQILHIWRFYLSRSLADRACVAVHFDQSFIHSSPSLHVFSQQLLKTRTHEPESHGLRLAWLLRNLNDDRTGSLHSLACPFLSFVATRQRKINFSIIFPDFLPTRHRNYNGLRSGQRLRHPLPSHSEAALVVGVATGVDPTTLLFTRAIPGSSSVEWTRDALIT